MAKKNTQETKASWEIWNKAAQESQVPLEDLFTPKEIEDPDVDKAFQKKWGTTFKNAKEAKAFQKANGLIVDGKPGKKTMAKWNELQNVYNRDAKRMADYEKIEKPLLSQQQKEKLINKSSYSPRAIEDDLIDADFQSKNGNYFSNSTQLKRYQKENGLKETGVIDEATKKFMHDEDAKYSLLGLKHVYNNYWGNPEDNKDSGIELDYYGNHKRPWSFEHSKEKFYDFLGEADAKLRRRYFGVEEGSLADNTFAIINATPSAPNTNPIALKIDPNKFTKRQAEAIARGLGYENYTYGDKQKKVNLFTGGKYADKESFMNAIEKAKNDPSVQKQVALQNAQNLYNEELARQYGSYGIDNRMLHDKNGYAFNNILGAIPYSYDDGNILATMGGIPSVRNSESRKEFDDVLAASNMGGKYMGYKYDPVHNKDARLQFDNFDEWNAARMQGDSRYYVPGTPGISPTRAVTSTYSLGFPVQEAVRNQLAYDGARPNADDIDTSNYYRIVDNNRGNNKMQASIFSLYNNATNKNKAKEYLEYISNGDIDPKKANRLAAEAGIPEIHNAQSYQSTWHGTKDAVESFVDNGFDDDGNLRNNFKYAESGYDAGFDGGGYTVFINNGMPQSAQDNWNMENPFVPTWLGEWDFGINTNEGKGIRMINRLNGQTIDSDYWANQHLTPKNRVQHGRTEPFPSIEEMAMDALGVSDYINPIGEAISSGYDAVTDGYNIALDNMQEGLNNVSGVIQPWTQGLGFFNK